MRPDRSQPQFQPQAKSQSQSSSPVRPLYLLFWCVGILMGLFVREAVVGGQSVARSANPPAVAAGRTADQGASAPTTVVNLRAVLELPTAPPTATATAQPSPTPVLTPALDFCDARWTGEDEVCRMPYATPTPSPTLPTCYSAEAVDGEWCAYRATATPRAWAGRDGAAGGTR
jgi:hypothetical protein